MRYIYLTLAAFCVPTAHAVTEYQISVASDLSHLAVELRNDASARLTDQKIDYSLIRDAQRCDGASLSRRALSNSRCARYKVRLREGVAGRFAIDLPDDVRVINPEHFLFLGLDSAIQIELDSAISHPWPELSDGRYTLPRSPRSSNAVLVIGGFHKIHVEGLRKPVAFIGEQKYVEKMRDWLEPVVQAVSYADRFPNPDLQVIALSVNARSGSPVPFGHVIRNQGETVRFFVDPSRSIESLHHDWTASHELAHLKLPYLSGSGRWLSEGFASYYQNVLQARLGFYSEEEAWQRLGRSFSRAAPVGEGMSPIEATQAEFWRSRLMIYWSGAAFALLADVELRRRGVSLDATLARLDTPQNRSWHPRELMRRLDEVSKTNVFTALYQQHANSDGMPPTEALFDQLGVMASGELRESAPLASLRREIMSAQ